MAYHDEYPRDFGPLITYAVSLISESSRSPIWQGRREMSAPRPQKTDPFRPPALYHQVLYICLVILLVLPHGIFIVSFTNALLLQGRLRTIYSDWNFESLVSKETVVLRQW